MDLISHQVAFLGGPGLALSHRIEEYLEDIIPDSPLHQLWCWRYVDGNVLVLPREKAIAIAESHERGYHHGLWHLATQYEKFMAMALLLNSNRRARGFGDPKSFSAWERWHDKSALRAAADFRKTLNENVAQTEPEQRRRYRPN